MAEQFVIYEQAYIPAPKTGLRVIRESKLEDGSGHKAVFKCILQEANVVNQNKRRYGLEVIKEIVNQLQPKAKNRALLGEVDHPDTGQLNEQIIMRRAATVKLKDAGILIRDIKLDGKYVIGECETLNTRHGQDIFGMIKENVQIGFSLRALGSMKTGQDGIIDVIKPIKAITYDVVANPSHANALVMNFVTESSQFLDFEDARILTEDVCPCELGENATEFGKIKICNENSCIMLDRADVDNYILENINLSKFKKLKLTI